MSIERIEQSVPAAQSIRPKYTITPGVGIRGCSIGTSVKQVLDLLGTPNTVTPNSVDEDYVRFYRHGVDVLTEKDRVRTLFFYFRSRKHVTFDGLTDKGIGMWSTIPEVIKLYGEPSRIGESTVSTSGDTPGAHEYYLEYPHLGIAFTFYDNELADIRVFQKASSP